MDEQTALVLAVQLLALFSIAGALLLYLLCKIRPNSGSETTDGNSPGGGKPVLVTSADNALGLQIAVHLANRGFRVFAGLRDGASSGSNDDSASSRVVRAWQKHRESLNQGHGALIGLPLDVTREDLLHESVDIIRAHLPAGEDGLWAVINTSGLSFRGRLDQQDISHWDAMFKNNFVGVLRTSRTFQGLLRNTSGRILTFGIPDNCEAGLVAYTASRYAVEGASNALRQELAPLGIKVIILHPSDISAEAFCSAPKLNKRHENDEISVNIGGCIEYQPVVLNSYALQILDVAITTGLPNDQYSLSRKFDFLPTFGLLKGK